MDVDRSARGHVEHGPGQDLAEGDDDGDVRAEFAEPFGPPGVPQPWRLEHGQPGLERALLHRWRRQPLAAMRGPIGLGDDADHTMVAQERVERGERELRRAVEEDVQRGGGYSANARWGASSGSPSFLIFRLMRSRVTGSRRSMKRTPSR